MYEFFIGVLLLKLKKECDTSQENVNIIY